MISGVAQVIAMKPIFRSRFSSGPPPFAPPSCAIASSAPSGSSEVIAARAVVAPTACRKRRRRGSLGSSAFTSVASMKSREKPSAPIAAAWSAGTWSAPQRHLSISGRSAS